MKVNWIAVLVAGIFVSYTSAQEALKTELEKESYALGTDLARNLKRQGVSADAEALARGVRDEFAGGKLQMTEEELHQALNLFQTELKLKRARNIQLLASENKSQGESFLSSNKVKAGVITLPSGLQYKIIKQGDGKKPSADDTVNCRYRATLIDGTEFENSYSTGRDAVVKLATAIPGWREALELMPAGSKWQLFVPSALAYGEKGTGKYVGPNATLIFDLELVSIQ
jgi:FKBP-type peptidyl-prolyl cis-trans isomerase